MNPVLLITVALTRQAGSITPTIDNHETFDLTPLVAHEGGWDEAMLVGLPLALIGLLLWVANRRVSAQLAAATADDENPDHEAIAPEAPTGETDAP